MYRGREEIVGSFIWKYIRKGIILYIYLKLLWVFLLIINIFELDFEDGFWFGYNLVRVKNIFFFVFNLVGVKKNCIFINKY